LKILGIIPARGGSKGIPCKNIKKLAGKPLIEYTISNALKSKKIDKVLVSTDSKKIANISKKLGAQVPFLRPNELSNDTSKTIDVVKHALKFLHERESYIPEIVVILQPTSPFRSSRLIDKSVTLLMNSNSSSVISVSKVKTHPYSSFSLKNKHLLPFSTDFEKHHRRQSMPVLYHPTGSIYTFWNKIIKKHDSIYGKKIIPLIEKEGTFIDIDSPFDFSFSEIYLSNNKKNNFK